MVTVQSYPTKTNMALIEITAESPGLAYHRQHELPLSENVYRSGSREYFKLFRDARTANFSLTAEDDWFLASDLGTFAEYRGRKVPLDFPIEVSAAETAKGEKVKLNSPMRAPAGHAKKFIVYVKDGDKIVQVGFGQRGMAVKNLSDERRKSFLARHRCTECSSGNAKCPKTSPRYWSCNVHRYHKQLGLKSDKPW